jgi:hypothetical protein
MPDFAGIQWPNAGFILIIILAYPALDGLPIRYTFTVELIQVAPDAHWLL